LNPEIRLDHKELMTAMPKKPSRIFVGSTIDLFHPGMSKIWIADICREIRKYPEHTFLFLTKFGENYQYHIFPDNCWLGISYQKGWKFKPNVLNINNKRFISIEPLLQRVELMDIGSFTFDWWICGGLSPKPVHEKQWVDEIIKYARILNKPLFLKKNLHYPIYKQEFPK
jgi:protein gp37